MSGAFFMMMASAGSGNKYTPLEYIEATGTQYILLPLGFEPTDEVSMTGFLSNATNTDRPLIGTYPWNNPGNTRFSLLGLSWSGGRKLASQFGASSGIYDPPVTLTAREVKTISYANRVFTCDASTLDVSAITFASVPSSPVSIFRTINGNYIPGGIKHYRHVKGDTVFDGVPVLWAAGAEYIDGNSGATVTPSAAKPGLLDTISGRLFVNQGSDEFTYA